MVETLLSPSNVLLFGRKVEDLAIVNPAPAENKLVKVDLASIPAAAIDPDQPVPAAIDGINTALGMTILIKDSSKKGIYVIKAADFKKKYKGLGNNKELTVLVIQGTVNHGAYFSFKGNGTVTTATAPEADSRHGPFIEPRMGIASEIEQQLAAEERAFARIYAFSFEGYYYELPRPVLFLVHGDGLPASEMGGAAFSDVRPARAPGSPSRIGLGGADFQFGEDILVWSYDKADYTIRMDVESGMFEQVLLDAMLGGPGGMDAAGMNARGMNARGMNARGMNARGMNARGMNARGGNSD